MAEKRYERNKIESRSEKKKLMAFLKITILRYAMHTFYRAWYIWSVISKWHVNMLICKIVKVEMTLKN